MHQESQCLLFFSNRFKKLFFVVVSNFMTTVMKKSLSIDARNAVVKAKQSGKTDREVAEQFGVSHTTVGRIYRKFLHSNSVERKPGSGRTRKSTEREDRAMIRVVKNDPRKTAVDVTRYAAEQLQLKLSSRTVRRRLCEANLFAHRPAKKPLISTKNRKARLSFARRFQRWSKSDWKNVLWSDESKFNLFSSDGIRYVRRPRGQRYNPKYQVPTVKHGGGSVMVWGISSFI